MIKVIHYNNKNECYKMTVETENIEKGLDVVNNYINKYGLWVDDIQINGGVGNYTIEVYHSKFVEPLWKIENVEPEYIEEKIPAPIIIYKDLFPILYYPELNEKGEWIWTK